MVFKRAQSRKPAEKGQALVEFTLATPVLMVIVMAAFMVGAAMYTGANASTALRNALQAQYQYADSNTAISDLTANVNSYNLGSFQIVGDNVDTITVTNVNGETPVIVARKSIKYPLFPTFNFVVTQGISGDVLRNNVDPFNLATDLVYNTAVPQAQNSIDPATELIDPVTVPATVLFTGPIDQCNPDFASLAAASASAEAVCTGAPYNEPIGCGATRAASLTGQHLAPMQALNACDPAQNKFWKPTDVTFDATAPTY